MADLIARLEALDGPSREVDAEIFITRDEHRERKIGKFYSGMKVLKNK